MTEHRRWSRLVGGVGDGEPIPSEWWESRSGAMAVTRLGPLEGREVTEDGEYPELTEVDAELYAMRRVTAGRTGMVLRAFVANEVRDAEALERIWRALMDRVPEVEVAA